MVFRWHLGQSAAQFFPALGKGQALPQTTVPVVQTGVVARNQIGQHMPQWQAFGLVELLDGPQCSGGGVGFFAPADAAFNVTIRVI